MSQEIENLPGLEQNVLLAPYTTFNIGGPARYFLVAKTKEEILNAVAAAKSANLDWVVLGSGSNMLVSDDGYDGLVIKVELNQIEVDEEKQLVRAGAGALVSGVIAQALKSGLAGLEFAIGVPATVGGAVWANLGARGREMKDYVIEISTLDENGAEKVLTKSECQFSYRDSIFKHEKHIILDVLFQLGTGDQADIKKQLKELTEQRQETQEVGAKTAGCAFQNPVEQTDKSAGQLIDELDLKGKQIGGAKISEKHANFIVNTGDATAEDVVMLISYIKQQVRDKKGVQLMEEIEYIGF